MDDLHIVELFWKRDEAAILETIRKYEKFCCQIAGNILEDERDVAECVNDTWMLAWTSIPPQKPDNLRAWLGRVTRNLAINSYKKTHRLKRYMEEKISNNTDEMLKELSECIPSSETVEGKMDEQELTECLNKWLEELAFEDRVLFVRRYWNGETVKNLAMEQGKKPAYTARRLQKLREKLRKSLEKEGYEL